MPHKQICREGNSMEISEEFFGDETAKVDALRLSDKEVISSQRLVQQKSLPRSWKVCRKLSGERRELSCGSKWSSRARDPGLRGKKKIGKILRAPSQNRGEKKRKIDGGEREMEQVNQGKGYGEKEPVRWVSQSAQSAQKAWAPSSKTRFFFFLETHYISRCEIERRTRNRHPFLKVDRGFESWNSDFSLPILCYFLCCMLYRTHTCCSTKAICALHLTCTWLDHNTAGHYYRV